MSKFTIVFITILVLILLSVGKYISVKNTLVAKNEAVKSAWSQVDVVLQRRADLIPNLVETVKGITKQEQTVFGEIAQARSQLLSANNPADKIAANQRLDGALGRLLAIAENYPQLPSSASATTTPSRTTTPMCSSSPIVCSRNRRALSQIRPTLRLPRHRAPYQK